MSQLMFEHRQVDVRGVLIPGRPLLNAIPQLFPGRTLPCWAASSHR